MMRGRPWRAQLVYWAGMLLLVNGWYVGGLAQPPASAQLRTVAESSQFEATANGPQISQFLARLAQHWDDARLQSLGTTVEGRAIEALIVEPKLSPRDADLARSITVLVLAGLHAGESDGREAILAVGRDIATSADQAWRHGLRLILVPNVNADGCARRQPNPLPAGGGTSGGYGTRENAQGLDLNRDFIKLESPEIRAVVKAIHEHDVDVLIDLHASGESRQPYQLTYDPPHNPAFPRPLDDYLRGTLLPQVGKQLSESRIDTFYYGNFNEGHTRWESSGHQPRYSIEYMAVRGRLGILAESNAGESLEMRFKSSSAFLQETLRCLARDRAWIGQSIDQAAAANQPGSTTAIAGRLALARQQVTAKGYPSPAGQPVLAPAALDQLQAQDYTVELWNRAQAIGQVQLPTAYAIDAQFAWAASRLHHHGVPLFQLTDQFTTGVERATITQLHGDQTLQGHLLRSLQVQWRAAEQSLPAGTYIVPASGPLARLIAYLLEPESEESLASWNFLDPYLIQGGDYPVGRLSRLPDSLKPVEDVAPTETLNFDLVMKPDASLNLSGTGRVTVSGWSRLSDRSEYVCELDGHWLVVEAASGATRPLSELAQLETLLSDRDEFTDQQARSVAKQSRFWLNSSPYSLMQHADDLYRYHWPSRIVSRLTRDADSTRELAELSPSGDQVAFVRANDLWVLDCANQRSIRLTNNGSAEMLNGILDWVYQEELYGRGNFKGFWWSPSGQQIAFLQLDQTQVPTYLVSDSVSIAQSLETTRYPKAGQPLPTARVWIATVEDQRLCEVDLSRYPAEDRLVGRVAWSPDGRLWLQVLNRVQNRLDLLQVEPATGETRKVLAESADWIEIRGTPEFLSDGSFLWLGDVPRGRTHLYHVQPQTGARVELTSGDWDVAELLAISRDERYAFVSGHPSGGAEQHLWRIDLRDGGRCQLTTQPGTHQAQLDAAGDYYLDGFSSLLSPPMTILRSTSDPSLERVLSVSPSDRHRYLKMQSPRRVSIPAKDGLPLPAMVLLPWSIAGQGTESRTLDHRASLDAESAEPSRLPVIFHVYGGPQAPLVRDQWQQRNYLWHQLLCAHGFAVVLCDNRSSQGRGIADTWSIRGDLGRVELNDLEAAVDWVVQQPWADPQRLGIWGWSYGGYLTAYAMTHCARFKAGIAGAPVTDWHNYDAIYTERYMDLPSQNTSGYESSSAVRAAANLQGRLLLIHGERDDNVHLSNSLQLADALQAAGKQFDLMIYPQARHAVTNPRQRYHMYRMMLDFWESQLKGPP